MATIEGKSETNISSEAFDILNCFVSGLDQVVYGIAADIARERHATKADQEPVQIEKQDIIQAGNQVVSAIKELIERKVAHPDVAAIIDQVEKCFTWHQQNS